MTRRLSPQAREENLRRLGSQTFDLLVIGGGIVGAAVARDAALRGLSVALVERGDFASGTSGKTSRLVHGGLRYLRNFKVRLVRQAVRERDVLLRRAPGLVEPLAFTIPAYEGRGMGKATLRFGLWVYDHLSKHRILPKRRWISAEEAKGREPRLHSEGLQGAAVYHDALTNDARLVLAVVRSAAESGAVVATYAAVTDLLRSGGRVTGARIVNVRTGEHIDARSAVVVNATGVWLDSIRTPPGNRRVLRPTKGIHVFLPRARVGNQGAVVLSTKRDGRMLFVLPWGGLSLVGTTDTDFRGSADRVLPEEAEVAYLLESVNDAFPEAKVGPRDVVSAYAGLRPLIDEGTPKEESDISREHALFEDPDGLLSVAGGKLTTHRAMAREVVDRVCRSLGRRIPCRTAEFDLGPARGSAKVLRDLGFDDATATFLAARHDPEDLRPWASEPSARLPIVPGLPYVWAELGAAVESEMALTLEDVMVRRLGLFYEAPDQGLSVAPAIARRMAALLGWDSLREREQLRRYQELVADHRRFREGHDR